MLSPDRLETQAPPQDLRHDLSEIRKGIWRLDKESPFSAVRRFREAERAYRQTSEKPEITVFVNPGFSETQPVSYEVIPNEAAMLKAEVEQGPTLRREFVFLDIIRIPHPFGEVRRNRPKRSGIMNRELKRIARDEADRLAEAIPDSGEIGETFLEAIEQDEKASRPV